MNKKINFGISGSSIKIENNILIKTSNKQRFKKQIEKQLNFKNIKCFKTPKILESNIYSDFIECKMEYVSGLDCIAFFYLADKTIIETITNNIIFILENNISKSKLKFVDKSAFLEKIKLIEFDQQIKKKVLDFISSFKQSEFLIPIGKCHGDFTFTNMIFQNNDIYLIDFLDSYIETPLQDIVKIRQETKYFWSVYEHKNKNTEIFNYSKIAICYSFMDSVIDNYFKKYDWYKKYYKLFQIINLCRILPYNNDESIDKHLKNSIVNLLGEQ